MMFAQYCRIESMAGGLSASTREFIRAARTRLNAHGKSREAREARHQWIRAGLAHRTSRRKVYDNVQGRGEWLDYRESRI